MIKNTFVQLSKHGAILGLLLLSPFANSTENSCPELKAATYTCSREFSFFDDKVPWKPQTFKIEKPLLASSNSFSWSFDTEVGTWILDGTVHRRVQFIDVELSQAQCLSDGKIEAVEVFRSPRLFDVRRDMTLVKLENSLRITFQKDILIGGHSTNSDEEKWTCTIVAEPEISMNKSLKKTIKSNLTKGH